MTEAKMATNYIQPGDTLELTAPAALASGQGALVGAFFGVALSAAESGARVNMSLTGVWELPKVSAQAWTEGQAIYWIAADGTCTTASSGNTLIGKAAAAAANPSAIGVVRLNG
jgi:predicted RecA/RadA family phage recombinase